ncbi:MAG: diacylglycerol/lipid kinase family protein [Acidimicrobiia bacterium]
MIKPGEEWGSPTTAPADATVRGDDRALAAYVEEQVARDRSGDTDDGPLVRFEADGSDFARAVGLGDRGTDPAPARGIALPVDVVDSDAGVVVNALVLGTPPVRLRWWHRRRPVTVTVDGRETFRGQATTVVVANGQFLGPADVAPRGHPGDGRVEVQVYALAPGERGPMRRRLASGTHLPHPRITATSGRSVRVEATAGGWPLEADGVAAGRIRGLSATVRPRALRLLV